MTYDYAQHMTREAMNRLKGMENLLMGEDSLNITLSATGDHQVYAITKSVSGASTAYIFAIHGDLIREIGHTVLDTGVA